MAQIRKRKLSTLVLCIMFLLTLCGCQTKQPGDGLPCRLPLDKASIDYLESSIFGMSPDGIIEELHLSKKEYEEAIPPGLLYIERPITAAGKEFTEVPETYNGRRLISFVFTSPVREEAQCNGVVYRCKCESAEELAEVAEAAYRDAAGTYEPANQGHLSNARPLCGEGAFDEIRETGDDYIKYELSQAWGEAWCVGEYSYLEILVWASADRGLDVEWSYFVLPEEWQHYDPEYEPHYVFGHPISFRRSIRGEYLVEQDD